MCKLELIDLQGKLICAQVTGHVALPVRGSSLSLESNPPRISVKSKTWTISIQISIEGIYSRETFENIVFTVFSYVKLDIS